MFKIQTLSRRLLAQNYQELLVNGCRSIQAIAIDGQVIEVPTAFSCPSAMYEDLQEFASSQGVRIDPLRPTGGGIFQIDGEDIRWHVLMPPVAEAEPILSLRRMGWESHSLEDFALDSLTKNSLLTLKNRRCVFFSGPTGSGKTTLLSCLLKKLAYQERTFILETQAELPLSSPSWVRLLEQESNLEGRGAFPMAAIFRESLRLRPDRYVLGEVRGGEAGVLFQVLLSSHQLLWATIHVDGPELLISRLANLSGIGEDRWQSLFSYVEPVYVQLQRKQPRIAGLFEFCDTSFRSLTSCQKLP